MDTRISDALNQISDKAFITLQYYSYEADTLPDITDNILRDVSKIKELAVNLENYLKEKPCAHTEESM